VFGRRAGENMKSRRAGAMEEGRGQCPISTALEGEKRLPEAVLNIPSEKTKQRLENGARWGKLFSSERQERNAHLKRIGKRKKSERENSRAAEACARPKKGDRWEGFGPGGGGVTKNPEAELVQA